MFLMWHRKTCLHCINEEAVHLYSREKKDSQVTILSLKNRSVLRKFLYLQKEAEEVIIEEEHDNESNLFLGMLIEARSRHDGLTP